MKAGICLANGMEYTMYMVNKQLRFWKIIVLEERYENLSHYTDRCLDSVRTVCAK